MLDLANIRLLTPEEQAVQAAKLREQEELDQRRQLEILDQFEWRCERGGRPLRQLPEHIARRVWDDFRAGMPQRAIVRKYQGTPWAFSRSWLQRAIASGALAQMAGVAQLTAQNPAKKAPALTTI